MSSKVSHIFQVQLEDTKLSAEQRERLATVIRKAAASELLRMDFRIEELKPLFSRGAAESNCGGGCRGCKAVAEDARQ